MLIVIAEDVFVHYKRRPRRLWQRYNVRLPHNHGIIIMYMRKPSKPGEEWEWTMERIICTLLRYALTDDSCQMIIISKYSLTSSYPLPHTVIIIIIVGPRQDMPSLYCPSYVKRAFHFNYSTWMILIHFWQGFLHILGICLFAPDGHTVLCCTDEPYNYTFLWPGIIHSGNPNIPDLNHCLSSTVHFYHPQRNLTSRTYNLVNYTTDDKSMEWIWYQRFGLTWLFPLDTQFVTSVPVGSSRIWSRCNKEEIGGIQLVLCTHIMFAKRHTSHNPF